ncbi:ankyrin [Penicillium verhagenii]|uniref:ankyrin n=1 Tax=Penicillium verhagenii TaxID=1562060 RepID=UPI0025454BF4|nr:ankyrin [Penicillium verhagenii]KAJ5934487.1 ankyrin [Penicillium verhagenii]
METSAWEAHKGEIEHLYLRENKTLDALRQIMRTKHGFSKTKNQYQVKLNRWGFRKYRAGPEKWKYIKHRLEVRQQQNRILSQRGGKYHSGYESQDCEVYIDGVLYSSATVKCEIRRQAFESTYRRFAIGILTILQYKI